LKNAGRTFTKAKGGLLTTVAYELEDGKGLVYAHEGSVAAAGSSLEWLVEVGIGESIKQIDSLVEEVGRKSNNIIFVPAFTGLFCPHWRPDARGVILGLTFGTKKGHICTAGLEAIALQVVDLLRVSGNDIK